jgi:uncharacterized protein (DUF983 family)
MNETGNQFASDAAASRGTTLARGLTKRCARCGSGKLFRHWVTMVPECPRCGLTFERESGYWAGALAINFICTGGLFIIAFAIIMVATLPDLNVALALGVVLPIAILGPLVWYPFSKTLWVAIDRAYLQLMDRNEQLDK